MTLKPYRDYGKYTSEYRNHIRLVVNQLKHHQGRLRPLALSNDDHIIAGYYVEGVYPSGEIGPNPLVHHVWKDKTPTAFSFARDLRYHLCWIYFNSRYLAEAISQIVKDQRIAQVPDSSDSLRVADVVARIANTQPMFFPDERIKHVPDVRFGPNNEITTIRLAYPDGEQSSDHLPEALTVRVFIIGDGVSRKFKLPYFPDKREHQENMIILQKNVHTGQVKIEKPTLTD